MSKLSHSITRANSGVTLIHIDIDVQDEQEASRILSLLTREDIPH